MNYEIDDGQLLILETALADSRATTRTLEELLEDIRGAAEPVESKEARYLLTTNQEKDSRVWAVGSVIANHGIWKPSKHGAPEQVQADNLRKLWAQVAAFESEAIHWGGPAIFDTDGRGTWWYKLARDVRQRIITRDTLGLRHFSVFHQWTSRHLRHPESRWDPGVDLKLHDPKVATETLAAHENISRAVMGTVLPTGGRLGTRSLGSQGKLVWVTDFAKAVSLEGITPTFGALHTTRINPSWVVNRMRGLGSNYQRWWVGFEPWTALADPETALSPWAGKPGAYDLHSFNETFWKRLRDATAFADGLGMVMHYSLMNHASFINTHEPALWGVTGWNRWKVNPWNANNNRQGLISEPVKSGQFPRSIFSTSGPVWDVWKAFLERFRAEVGGFGNVLVELANEPPGVDKDQELEWHQASAEVLAG